jgi:hypothetical protein
MSGDVTVPIGMPKRKVRAGCREGAMSDDVLSRLCSDEDVAR